MVMHAASFAMQELAHFLPIAQPKSQSDAAAEGNASVSPVQR